MAWVFFQVFLALGIGVAIVWWTWPKDERAADSAQPQADSRADERD
jgi:hypothetical protein